MIDGSAYIDPQARIDRTISVGARTKIWQFASVIRGTKLGEDCTVASSATLDGPVFGDRCIISQGVAMGPGFKFGNDIFIGPNVTICNDRWPLATKDGFKAEEFRSGEKFAVIVNDNVGIGANAVVLPGVIIGSGCMIAAGAVVNRSVPANHLFRRNGSIKPIGSDLNVKRMWVAGEC